jgi:hypothetical protein
MAEPRYTFIDFMDRCRAKPMNELDDYISRPTPANRLRWKLALRRRFPNAEIIERHAPKHYNRKEHTMKTKTVASVVDETERKCQREGCRRKSEWLLRL